MNMSYKNSLPHKDTGSLNLLELNSIGIKYGKVRNWSINTRAKCRLGQCKKIAPGLFDINISNMLLGDSVDDQITKDTIVHELLHTVPGCFTHKGKWKLYAEHINRKLPQYNIKRVIKGDEAGINIERKKPVYKYVLRCTKCGQEIKRQNETKVVINYKKYHCGKCGGKLERIFQVYSLN